MPFNIVRDDITHLQVDAIVNAANNQLMHGGGVCGAIFRAAGARRLQAACDEIGYCATGQAVATSGYDLPARYVIHTVGPVWQGGDSGEPEQLASCYRTSLELASTLKCRSVAFPLISSGIYGYPKREALAVAQREIRAFLENYEMDVTLVLFDRGAVELAEGLRLRVERYIDDVYVGDYPSVEERRRRESLWSGTVGAASLDMSQVFGERLEAADAAMAEEEAEPSGFEELGYPAPSAAMPMPAPAPAPAPAAAPSHSKPLAAREADAGGHAKASRLPRPLRKLLKQVDAGFSDTLMTLIDERGLKDADVYKRANLSRQHFSKIRSNPRYQPKKNTVLALAVALQLSLEETSMLLERAGFAFSHADRRDIIVEFFIREGNYDVFEINEALFAFDQPLLG